MTVIDCTSSPPSSSLQAAGVTGVIRYLTWPYYWGGTTHSTFNPKLIRAAEYNTLIGAGIDVVLNWEFDAQDWLSGAGGGAAHATEAVSQAKALGYPQGQAIYGSCDFNMSPAEWNTSGWSYVSQFSSIIRAAGYRVGVYAPYDVLTWCRDAGLVDYFWQAGMSTAWSEGRNASVWPGVHLRQVQKTFIGGVECDVNDVHQDNYGQRRDDMATSEWHDVPGQDMAVCRVTQGRPIDSTAPAGTRPTSGVAGHQRDTVASISAEEAMAANYKADLILARIDEVAAQGITDAQVSALAAAIIAKIDLPGAIRAFLHNV